MGQTSFWWSEELFAFNSDTKSLNSTSMGLRLMEQECMSFKLLNGWKILCIFSLHIYMRTYSGWFLSDVSGMVVWHENDAARHCVVDIWWTIYLFGLNWSIRQCSMNGTIHTKSVYFTIFYLQKFIYPSIYENKCLSTQCGQLHTALQIVQYSLCVICTGDCRRYICSCFFLYCFVRIYLIPLSMQICINGCVLFILNTNTFYSGYAKWG